MYILHTSKGHVGNNHAFAHHTSSLHKYIVFFAQLIHLDMLAHLYVL